MGIRGKSHCPICDKPLGAGHARLFETCTQGSCRAAYRQQTGRIRYIRLRQEVRRQRAAEADRRYQYLCALSQSRRGIEALAAGITNPESYTPILLPTNQRKIVPLSRQRRYRFAKRLQRLLDTIDWNPPTQKSGSQEIASNQGFLATMLSKACAICRGHCCMRGDTHAYLDGDTIQHFLHHHTQPLRLSDILTAYCRHLPTLSYANSCVFHAARGCILPRNLRSETCHAFLCTGLLKIQKRKEKDGQAGFFFAANNKETILRSGFVATVHS